MINSTISKPKYSLRLHFVCVSLSLNGIYHILTVWQEPGCRLQVRKFGHLDTWTLGPPEFPRPGSSCASRSWLICISHCHACEMLAKVSQLLIRGINNAWPTSVPACLFITWFIHANNAPIKSIFERLSVMSNPVN